MSIEILTFEQGTPEWYAARLGLVTASELDTVQAQGKGNNPSKTRRTYMLKLLGEKLTGEPKYDYNNDHMDRGKATEGEARDTYAFIKGVEPQRVGFIRNAGLIRNGIVGCSPDSLIGDKGMLEIKTKLAHLQLEALLAKELPSEHRAQVQGQLWVAEREWCDFVSYWPKLPPLIVRVHRDDIYIAKMARAVEIFYAEMKTLEDAISEAA